MSKKLGAWAKEYVKNHTLRSADELTKNYIDLLIQRCRQSEKRTKELEKAYNETEELLDKQIEATYNLYNENKELKEQVASLSKALVLNTSEEKDDEKLAEAKELLGFWVNDFYDGFNSSSKFAERHEFLQKTEQFLKEVKV